MDRPRRQVYLVPWQPWQPWPDCCTPRASLGEDGLLRRATGPPYCVPIPHRGPNPAGDAGSNPEKKKSPFGKEDRCICSPCSAEAARSRREGEMSPLLDCGVRMCSGWGRAGSMLLVELPEGGPRHGWRRLGWRQNRRPGHDALTPWGRGEMDGLGAGG